jgi:predicted membrane-bound mannosyltransferase
MVLLAGVGAAVLVRAAPGYVVKTAVVAALIAAAGHLGWQAYRASFVACDDPSNPYVYVPTTADVPLLARRVRAMAALHPDGKAMHVQVICPDGDYWPLPWYLRDFSRVGWFSRVPGGPAAPLIITQPQMKEAVLEYVYVKQPPGQPRLMQLLEKRDGVDWQLRPNVPLLVLLRLDLYEAYRAAADRP